MKFFTSRPDLRPRSLWFAALFAVACCSVTRHAIAQQPNDDAMRRPRLDTSTPAPTQPQGGGMIKQQGRPFYLQGAVVVLLTGGAVWTVCRSSRRQ